MDEGFVGVSFLEALVLGIIQGLTEFFPVSSSGHLKLMQALLGFEHLDRYIVFDLTCHLGTLLAIFLVFRQEIAELLCKVNREWLLIFCALLPLFPLYFILAPIKEVYNHPEALGFFFLINAGILSMGEWAEKKAIVPRFDKAPKRSAFAVGIFQAIALLPGISRSGSTISSARLLGLPFQRAVRLSFLLAIPTILGGSAVEFLHLLKEESSFSISPLCYIVGFTASFAVGYYCLLWLKKRVGTRPLRWFVWYSAALGIVCLLQFDLLPLIA